MEVELSTKQFEYALIVMLFSGVPSLYDVKLHIKLDW